MNEWIKSLPKGGHGYYRKIALHLDINSVMVSQIFKSDRNLTEEQALALTDLLGLSELATEYFILMVQFERAGTHRLKKRWELKMNHIRQQSQDLKTRITQDKELSDLAKTRFYSNWYYSGIRLATSLPDCNLPDQIAQRLQLSVQTVHDVLQFLVESGLCVHEDGVFKMGPQRTHLSQDSYLIGRHRQNWRTKATTRIDQPQKDDLFYSGPMSISKEGYNEFREELVHLVEKVTKLVVKSEPETLACLNLDWFKL